MKQAILFTLSFAAISLFLTWLWLSGGKIMYADMITPLANEIYDFVGLHRHGTMRRDRFINFVPFTALMLLTPRLSARRRFAGLAIGLLIIMASHIAMNGIAVYMRSPRSIPRLPMLVSDATPFLLWFVFAREFVSEVMSKVRGDESDSPNDAPAESGSRAEVPSRGPESGPDS